MPTVSHGISKWSLWRGATLEDFSDRLNHFWTTGFLLILACIISWKHSYKSPIQCWVPVHFPQSSLEYTETVCWYKRFHYISEVNAIPHYTIQVKQTGTLYQYLPVIICFQALLFKLPNLLMYILYGYSGINFEKIASLSCGYHFMNMEDRAILAKQAGRYIFNWCKQCVDWLPWRFLTLLWLVIKILYCVNIIAQLWWIDTFLMLRPRYPPFENPTSYGDIISGNLFQNNATIWKESPAFPRSIFCDFHVKQLRNDARWTVQCEISANHFNEFVYMFLWVWFLFVAIVTCLSLVAWTFTTILPSFRKCYIKKALALSEDVLAIAPCDIDKFCNIIGEDGVMALKLISTNSSELFVSNLVGSMWRIRNSAPTFQQGGVILSQHGGQILSPQGGQILSVHETQAHGQPSAPMASGSSIELKQME